MTRTRRILFALSCIGLAWSVWSARPMDVASIFGWLFAAGWSSAAWLGLVAALAFGVPLAAALGSIVILVCCELFIQARGLDSDALILAVKPIYEVPAALIAGLVAGWLSTVGNQDA